jgi:formylglycine-generating enzyme required for sulfatase activity
VRRNRGIAGTGVAAVLVLGSVWAFASRLVRAPHALGTPALCSIYAGVPAGWPAFSKAGMVRVNSGDFEMGSSHGYADEKPAGRVHVGGFWIDRTEVTNAQFAAFARATRYVTEAEREGGAPVFRKTTEVEAEPLSWWHYERGVNWQHPDGAASDLAGREHEPVVQVTQADTRAYARWLGHDLPTEAEWEFAARGSDGRIYPWGDALPSAEHLNACGSECVAWMKKHPDPDQPIHEMYAADDGYVHTAPVGSFPKGASSWGIQDIVGNVWEWVADWHAPYDAALADTMTVDPKGPPTGRARVIRGGGWNAGKPAWARPAWRFQVDPKMRTHGIGFRCARSG